MFNKSFVALDIETTGLVAGVHEIIEIGAVKIKKGEISEEFQTLVKPQREIPPFIQELTGINQQMVSEAPSLADILSDLKKFLGRSLIVGHNISFDLNFINAGLKKPLSNKYIDTWQLAKIILPRAKSHSLAKLTDELMLEHPDKHRALADAMASAKLLQYLYNNLKTTEFEFILKINELLTDSLWSGKMFFEEYSKGLFKKFPNTKVSENNLWAAPGIEEDDGLFQANSEENEVFPAQLDYKKMSALLEPDGLLSKNLPGFESRTQQKKILLDVCRAFNENKILLMEAGTGAGKSFSYLIPSIFWAYYNQEKVVVATNTISLQEQLWEKDIPILRKILKVPIKASILKGRNNYLCLRKWQEKTSLCNNDEETIFALRILFWIRQTVTGDKSELKLLQTENDYWQEIAADSETCLGVKCPWFEKYCYVMRARRQAELSDLLIINHSLLLTDVKTENRLIPAFKYLIIDEAHHLEDGATEQLATEISSFGLNRFLNGLYTNQANSRPGLFQLLKNKLNKHIYAFDSNDLQKALEEIKNAEENIFSVKTASDEFFRALQKLFGINQKSEEQAKNTFRLKPEHKNNPAWAEIENARANLGTRLTYLLENHKKLVNIIERQQIGEDELLPGEKKDLLASIGAIKQIISAIDLIINLEEKNHVFWFEAGLNHSILKAAPINVGQILYANLLQNKKTIVFTSATLSVDGNFEYFQQRIGLDYFREDKFIASRIDSPFDYERQALLAIVNDLPVIAQEGDCDFPQAIIPFLRDLLRITGGRTMLLFTSHKMLQEVYYSLQKELTPYNITLLGDGIDGNRNRIINRFKEKNNCVILGTNNFWEGIDLPGDLLNCVVIIKIPFWPPGIPAIEARLEDLQSRNIDGFWNYSLPQAVIRLKQGFGRLIRTQKDKGVVIILDKRVITKKYGYKMLHSLPLKRHFKGDQGTVLQKIRDWLTEDNPDIQLNIVNSAERINKMLKDNKIKR